MRTIPCGIALVFLLATAASGAEESRFLARLHGDDHLYWRDRIGIEFQPARSRIGSAYQLTWHALDEHPRDSKEGIIELTARFFF